MELRNLFSMFVVVRKDFFYKIFEALTEKFVIRFK